VTNLIPEVWLIAPGLLLAGLAGALVAAILFSLLVIGGGPVDRPRQRGMHDQPTPTSGGLAVMAATGLATGLILWLLPNDIPGGGKDGLALFGFAVLMGLTGAADDLLGLPAKLRLGIQVTLCLAFGYLYRVDTLTFGFGSVLDVWWPVGMLGAAAWLVLCINAINFMDGSNGLAIGAQGIALAVIILLAELMAPSSAVGAFLGIPVLISACAAGAHLGFLPFNLPPRNPCKAKAFQGDAGAFFSGALIGGVCLQLKAYNVGSVWFGGFLLAPLLVDVVLTLTLRARQRKNLLQAHKEHLYQLWLQRRDPSHLNLALRVWGLCLASSMIGLSARFFGVQTGIDVRFPALLLVVAAYGFGWFAIRRQLFGRPVFGQSEKQS
jgi:UDP-GlcNAc:undecaprenyl-phosphate/decaprenyl-phosphate GlcNAc-1-phosphate transferase